MLGNVGLYQKPDGREEVRIHFPEWRLPDGSVIKNVTLFPHPCAHCIGGDHTHVELNDVREPLCVLEHECVSLSREHHLAVSSYLAEKQKVDALTGDLIAYLGAHAPVHA